MCMDHLTIQQLLPIGVLTTMDSSYEKKMYSIDGTYQVNCWLLAITRNLIYIYIYIYIYISVCVCVIN